MAILLNPHGRPRVMLRPLHAFGRHPTACRTVLQCPDVSQIHALVRWNCSRWEILDQSRNGTFVDHVRLPHGSWTTLEGGCEVSMGNCPDAQWRVHDLAPPGACLLPCGGDRSPIALRPQGMFLPIGEQPELHIHCRDGTWIAEEPHGAVALDDGAVLILQGLPWEAVLSPELALTRQSPPAAAGGGAAEIVLRFDLSQNEEHAQLCVEIGGQVIDLGERAHHYTLATLARVRLHDTRRGLDAASQGWLSTAELSRMLGVDVPYVNIQIFRARHQFAGALPAELAAPMLIERRRGELRLGDHAFTVKRGSAVEGGLWRGSDGKLAAA